MDDTANSPIEPPSTQVQPSQNAGSTLPPSLYPQRPSAEPPSTPSSGQPKTTSQKQRATRKNATLEQRRQVRYLARHQPYLNISQITKTVGCAYSAAGAILANTYRGGDADPDELPKDEAFVKAYGITGAAGPRRELNEGHPTSDDSAAAETQNATESAETNSGNPQGPLQIVEGPQNKPAQADLEWVSEFFNRGCSNRGLKVPDSVLTEMVAAGFKKWTVLNMMRTYPNRRDLANYLATILRITHAERDTIATLIMERRDWLLRGLKVEE